MIQVGMPEGLSVLLIVLSYLAGMMVGSWITDRTKLTTYFQKGKHYVIHLLPERARHFGERVLVLQAQWRSAMSQVFFGEGRQGREEGSL